MRSTRSRSFLQTLGFTRCAAVTAIALAGCGESTSGGGTPTDTTSGTTSTAPASTSSNMATTSTAANPTSSNPATTTSSTTSATAPTTTITESTTTSTTTSTTSAPTTTSAPMTDEATTDTSETSAASETSDQETTAVGPFTLSSPDHADGATFAAEVTCEACGFDANKMVMPGLEWTAGPEGTQSYAVVFIDTTLYAAGDQLGNHWALWNLPADARALPKGMKMADVPAGATQTGNFLGPCPSFGGTATHDYAFTLYALPTAMADFNSQGQATQVVGRAVQAFEAQALAKAELTGTSSAAPGQGGASCN